MGGMTDLAEFAKDLLKISVFGALSKTCNVEVVAAVGVVAGALISAGLSTGCGFTAVSVDRARSQGQGRA